MPNSNPGTPLQLTDDELREITDEYDRLAILDSPQQFAQILSRRDAEPWQPYKHLVHLNDRLMDIVEGRINRLIVTMPPRHGKSWLCSYYFPAWFLNRFPDKRVILCSYGDDFASEWGRKVRDLVRDNSDQLQIKINESSKAADRWDIEGHRGGMKTAGVGGQITGRGAHLFIIDDPVKDAAEANSATIREQKWDWWRTTARTRLEPGGAVIIIQCMTGDTAVLMADGSETPLRDIRPGDQVATYDDGKITSSTVRNWCNQGPDRVFEIRMTSGTVVKANARHPFLVEKDGETSWQRTAALQPGSVILRVTGGNGEASSAPTNNATSQPSAKACACRTTTSGGGRPGFDPLRSIRRLVGKHTCVTATGSAQRSMTNSSRIKAGSVLSASNLQPVGTLAHIGTGSSASITATTVARSEDCCATTATSRSATARPPKSSPPPLSTYEITRDVVVEVVEVGIEDVFDLQVDRTENFIANGLLAHNTRWHEDDLTGRILRDDDEAQQWHVVNLPALAEDDDPLGRAPGTALCPERYNENALHATRTDIGQSAFSALYQQRPQPEGGGAFKKDDFRYYTTPASEEKTYALQDPDGTLLVPQSQCWRFITMDLALTTRTTSDYTVAGVWDVAPYLDPQRLILVHVERKRIEGAEHLDLVKSLWDKWRPSFIGIEEAMQGSMTLAYSQRQGILVRPLKHKSKDKAFRAKDAELLVENHRVYFPKRAPWLPDFEHELLLFPTGTHDDQVDMFAYAAHQILRKVNYARPEKTFSTPTIEERCLAQARGSNKVVEHPVLGSVW